MSEPRPAGLFQIAEGASRHVALMGGLGLLAFVVGRSVTSWGVRACLQHDVVLPEVLELTLLHLWAWGALPPLAWLGARLLPVPAGRLTLVALASGEGFAWLVVGASAGFEWIFPSVTESVGRVVFVGLGGVLAWRAALAGRGQAERSQARANAEAQARQAEYAAALQRVIDAPERPPGPPPPTA